MGIKYLQSYLRAHPELKHDIEFEWKDSDGTGTNTGPLQQNRNILVWDAPGWLNRCFRAHSRSSKFLFDFKALHRECKNLIDTFNRFGFEVVAFIDGYFCEDKVTEKRSRKMDHLKSIRKNIQILYRLHELQQSQDTNNEEREQMIHEFDWMKSSGYFHFFERALATSGCTVYRGTGNNDIDKDIAHFVMDHKDSVYGIIACDSDYFGFADLPNHLKLIKEFHIKTTMTSVENANENEPGSTPSVSSISNQRKRQSIKSQTLSFVCYYAVEMWKSLGLQTVEQRLELICLVGNDFIKKRTANAVLKRCGIDPDQIPSEQTAVTAPMERDDLKENEPNESDMDLEESEDSNESAVIVTLDAGNNGNVDQSESKQIASISVQNPSERTSDRESVEMVHSIQTVSDMDLEDNELEVINTKMETLSLHGTESEQKETIEITVGADNNEQKETISNQHNVFEVAANAILNGTLKTPITIPDVVRDFYTIDLSQKLKIQSNVNPAFSDLLTKQTFNGGFFFHDIDKMGFCIHQKLASLRHALIRKYLKLDLLKEYIPEVEVSHHLQSETDQNHNDNELISGKVNVWKYREIDLKQRQYDGIDLAVELKTEWRGSGGANLYIVFINALQILMDRQWIDSVQSVALELQFQIRSISGLKRVYPKWPFYEEYREFVKNGIPTVKDLTAQSLYWECAQLICLNARNLMPPIHKLFDGPLFHFFCYLQRGGDEKGFIKEMMGALKAIQSQRGGRGRPRGMGRGRGRGRGTAVCSYYNGTEGSCRRGQQCRYQHVDDPMNGNWRDGKRRTGGRGRGRGLDFGYGYSGGGHQGYGGYGVYRGGRGQSPMRATYRGYRGRGYGGRGYRGRGHRGGGSSYNASYGGYDDQWGYKQGGGDYYDEGYQDGY